jgi:hypothetical protein
MLYVRSLRQIKWRMYTHVLLIPLITPCCMSDHYARYNHQCTHMCYWKHYQNHVVCQINMSDLMMNVNTCLTDNTTYVMLYVRYTHVVLITLLTLWCMSNHYPWFNDECTHIFYWVHYLHHGVYHISVSDLMVNVHTCITDITTYTMVYLRSFCQIW